MLINLKLAKIISYQEKEDKPSSFFFGFAESAYDEVNFG